MKHPESVRNRAIMEFIRKTMSHNHAAAILKLAVSMSGACLPFPAFILAALVYFFPKTLLRRGMVLHSGLMSRDKAQTLTANIPSLWIGNRTNRCKFAASTFTIFWLGWREVFTSIVPADKSHWFALNALPRSVSFGCDFSLLSATALTVTMRDFLVWVMGCGCEKLKLWGMICHVNSPFMTLTTAGTLARRLPPFIGSYSFNYSIGAT